MPAERVKRTPDQRVTEVRSILVLEAVKNAQTSRVSVFAMIGKNCTKKEGRQQMSQFDRNHNGDVSTHEATRDAIDIAARGVPSKMIAPKFSGPVKTGSVRPKNKLHQT